LPRVRLGQAAGSTATMRRLRPAAQLLADEGEGDAGEVAAAAGAADDHVGVVAGHFQLQHGLLADDGLVHQHVVQHRAQRVLGVVVLAATSTASLMAMPSEPGWLGSLRQDGAAAVGLVDGLAMQRGAVGFHQRAAVGLLVVGHPHLEDLTSMPNSAPANASDEPHWPAPVSVVSFLMPACVVPGLRHGGVGLVAAGGRHAFVLVVDLGRRAQRLFEPVRAEQRAGAPQAKTSRTGSGISISRSVDTSCRISSIGNSGARSSGPTGCSVPGCSGGGRHGRSAMMLYQPCRQRGGRREPAPIRSPAPRAARRDATRSSPGSVRDTRTRRA
jgi:hypothetical protein